MSSMLTNHAEPCPKNHGGGAIIAAFVYLKPLPLMLITNCDHPYAGLGRTVHGFYAQTTGTGLANARIKHRLPYILTTI